MTLVTMAHKLLERQYLNRALDLLGLRSNGEIQVSEAPDFLVPLGTETIGIEVTAFYLPEPRATQSHQARIGMQRIAVEQARRQFRSNGGPALYVTVFFVPDRDLSKARAYALGPILAHAVGSTRLPTSVHEPSARADLGLLPSEIADISIHGSVNATDELWYPAIAGWVAPIERSHIEAEIARKAIVLPKIRSKCEISWLLIVNDGFRSAAPCELSADAHALGFQSPFDRTLWLDSSRIYDLSTSCASRD